MTVITVSRQYGSGGDELAAWLSNRLEYPLFDKSLIDQAAVEAGFSQKEVQDFSEENHKVTTFLDRLFSRMAVSASVRSWEYPEILEPPIDEPLDEASMLNLVQRAVQQACQSGNIIIVGRGSQAILTNEPGVIHVRVVAPLEDRIQRVKDQIKNSTQKYQADLEIRRAAQDLILERDAASADYIKHFYAQNWDDPLLYTLILNLGHLTIEQAGLAVVELAHAMEPVH